MSVARFAVTGALGFAIDAGVFQVLHAGTGLSPYLARVPAFALAVAATYVLNRRWTFRREMAWDRDAALYVALQGVGVALNYAVFAGLIAVSARFAAAPVAAIVVASAVAAAFNYLCARALFRRG